MAKKSKLFASLRVLGVRPKMDTFADRKKVQKLVYLLDKVFDMNFDFSYSWYLHGPYSPELTKRVFDVIEGREVVHSDLKLLSKEDIRKIDRLKLFLGSDIKSSDKLELLVSLHYLMQYLKNPRLRARALTLDDIIAFLKAKKPYFTDEEISNCIDQLRILEG